MSSFHFYKYFLNIYMQVLFFLLCSNYFALSHANTLNKHMYNTIFGFLGRHLVAFGL